MLTQGVIDGDHPYLRKLTCQLDPPDPPPERIPYGSVFLGRLLAFDGEGCPGDEAGKLVGTGKRDGQRVELGGDAAEALHRLAERLDEGIGGWDMTAGRFSSWRAPCGMHRRRRPCACPRPRCPFRPCHRTEPDRMVNGHG